MAAGVRSYPPSTAWTAMVLAVMSLAASGAACGAGFEIPDLAGHVTPLVGGDRVAGALLFLTHDCPVCASYAPEIQRIVAAYAAKRVEVRVVLEDEGFDAAQARAWAAEYGIACPLALDPDHRLARLASARITPEAAVISPAGEVLYHGRIDDAWAALGKRRAQVDVHDLRDALDAVLAGTAPRAAAGAAVGCIIPIPSGAGP